MTASSTVAPWPWSQHFEPSNLYLNTAGCGLPPRVTSKAMTAILDDWRHGLVSGPVFDDAVADTRACYARFVHTQPDRVAIGHQTSPFVALLAQAVPDAATVLVPAGEFTSVTFPFAAHADRGVRVREVPLAGLADAIDTNTALVATSAVQSADGAIADLDAIEAAAASFGVDVLVDLTQAAGWFPVDADRFAYTVCSAYKWLLSPRGTAFMTVRPDRWDRLRPSQSGWYAGDSPWDCIYGLPLRLADDARRFDVSPAWFNWIGTNSSLHFLEQVGRDALHAHAVACEAVFAMAAGLAPSGSAIRSLVMDDAAPGIVSGANAAASVRAGRLRLSFHVNNALDDAEQIGTLLRGHVT